MTPTAAIAELTPYLLKQTAMRASLLQASFGFAADDWDDLRQDLALDCLRRLPRFDASRGSWQGFVHGVVRHHACVLASRQIGHRQFVPLEPAANSDAAEDAIAIETCEQLSDDFWPPVELGLDAQRVLAGLPEELRSVAYCVAEMPVSAVCRRTGLKRSQINARIRRIRAAFTAAGFRPRNARGENA